MDTKEQLLEVRDIARRLESILLELEPRPVCSVCGQALICAHCEGRKGGCKASQMSTREQRQENGRKGGRPRKQKVIVNPVTGASVPGTFSPVPKAQSANSPNYPTIEPAKYYKTEEVAQFIAVNPETLRHWRHKHKGPESTKLEGHSVRYSGKAVLDWLANHRNQTISPT